MNSQLSWWMRVINIINHLERRPAQKSNLTFSASTLKAPTSDVIFCNFFCNFSRELSCLCLTFSSRDNSSWTLMRSWKQNQFHWIAEFWPWRSPGNWGIQQSPPHPPSTKSKASQSFLTFSEILHIWRSAPALIPNFFSFNTHTNPTNIVANSHNDELWWGKYSDMTNKYNVCKLLIKKKIPLIILSQHQKIDALPTKTSTA